MRADPRTTEYPRCQVSSCAGARTAALATWLLPEAERDGWGRLTGYVWHAVCSHHADGWSPGVTPDEYDPPKYRIAPFGKEGPPT